MNKVKWYRSNIFKAYFYSGLLTFLAYIFMVLSGIDMDNINWLHYVSVILIFNAGIVIEKYTNKHSVEKSEKDKFPIGRL